MVFFPLEEWVAWHTVTWKFLTLSVALGIALVAAGMALERIRMR